jgi:superfamily II DNA or RNA helicase
MGFRAVNFPSTYKYSSDSEHIPLEFYEDVFPIAKKIDLLLGYFSSNAIKVLSKSFAEFIYNGGSMRIITNHVFSLKDKENLLDYSLIDNENKVIDIFSDIALLEKELSDYGQHFFDCLKYLLKEKRLQILPVKFNGSDLAHCKRMVLYDGEDYISTDGSINFTLSALIRNSESFEVNAPWKDEVFKERVALEKENFEKIFNKQHPNYTYLKPKDIEVVINKIGKDKNKIDLFEDEIKLPNNEFSKKVKKVLDRKKKKFNELVNQINNTPKFPYDEPRPYQKEAYLSWVNNNYKGVFAMATGTGKTLTALYCLIEEYKINRIQKNIFVVPGEELIRQWGNELRDCNFQNVFLWFSKNKRLKRDIDNIKILKNSKSINIIITYTSFKSEKFQKIFKNILNQYTLVFDEVHNMGAIGVRKALENIKFDRLIGLSATPLRLWDDDGENDFIEELFNSYNPNYTFSFPMKDAIGKFLVNYNYYPYFTNLVDDEWNLYLKYTSQIPISRGDEKINTTAALKRQLLLDQAENKTEVLLEIIATMVEKNNYKWTLVYAPKGKSNQDEDRIIHKLGEITAKKFKHLNIQFFVGETKGRELLLKDFEMTDVHMLFAIKVLDEGVNVPMAKNAIFLASGKNYREFVQRRGRILRKYETKTFKKTHANIYDIVVLPTLKQYKSNTTTAKKLIISEFKRLFEFYNMSIENIETFWQIENELKKYSLTQYYIENLIENE